MTEDYFTPIYRYQGPSPAVRCTAINKKAANSFIIECWSQNAQEMDGFKVSQYEVKEIPTFPEAIEHFFKDAHMCFTRLIKPRRRRS